MNLGQIRSIVIGKLRRTDAETAPINDYINLAVDRLARGVRVPSQEAMLIEPTLNGAIYIPNDLMEIKDLLVADGNNSPLDRALSIREIIKRRQSGGTQATHYLRLGNTLQFAPSPPDATDVYLVYWKEPQVLSAVTDINAFTRVASDSVVYGALVECADFFIDDRKELWEATFQQRLGELIANKNATEAGEGPMAVQPSFGDY